MADISPITLQLAQLQGHELYETAITQWGNVGTGTDSTSGGIQYPQLSIVGAEVHPRSEVEGFRIRWSPQPVQPSVITPPDTVKINDFFVMRDKPFMGRLQGPLALVPLPQDYYADLYISNGQQSTPVFGGAMAAGQFDAPELWAILWLSNEPRNGGARTHYRNGPNVRTLTGFATVDTVFALPVSGRKNIRVTLTSVPVPDSPASGAQHIGVALSGLAGNNTGVGVGLANRLQEYPIQSADVPASSTVVINVPNCPHQWLLCKAEVEADGIPGALSWRVDASDYP